MIVDKIHKYEDALIVYTYMKVNLPESFGKVELTPRWLAAGRSLLDEINEDKEFKLVQIDAGRTTRNAYLEESQQFIFYFEKEIKDG